MSRAMRVLPVVNVNVDRGSLNVTRRNEGVLPPQLVPVGRRLCQFVEGWKHITNDSFVLSIVAKVYRLRFKSPPLLLQTNFPNASEERNLRNISRHSRVLFEHIPGSQGIWRVAPSYRLKTTEPPHRCSSLSHAHYKLSAEYRRKRRLRVQNRSAGCVLSYTDTSRQQEVPSFCLRKQGIPISSTSLRCEHCPSYIYRGHTVAAYLHRQGISVIPYLDDWLIHHPNRQVLLRHQSQLLQTLNMVGLGFNEAKSQKTRTSSGYPVSRAPVTLGSRESFPPSIQSSADNSTRVPNILPEHSVVFRSVPIHGITQLGLRSHPTGSPVFEAPSMTFSFVRPDKPVYTAMSVRPFSSCHLTRATAGLIFSDVRNPYPTFPGRVHDFHGRLYPGLGRSHEGFPDCRCLDPFRMRAPHQCVGAQGGNIGPQTLGCSITGPSCYDRYRQYHCCSLYQQTGWDPFPRPV